VIAGSILTRLYPTDRDLSEPELRQLAAAVPETIDLTPHVRHIPGERHYERIHADDHVEIWVICWVEDADTGYHDHDRSSGAVHVVEGEIEEHLLAPGLVPPHVERRFGGGATFSFDEAHVHRLRHAGGPHAVSVHAYSPPLGRLGTYELNDDGALRRRTVPAEEELRPSGDLALV
jgi:hypothetical protein